MRWAVLLCALVGCVHDDLVQCADGTACPVGLVCDLEHQSCATQNQLDACTGRPDLAPCLVDSTCHEHVCLPNGCGNGRVDPPEACDDGNTIDADGCAHDCASDESCGNGTIDLVKLETCDDGNRRNHDGCDSVCTVEQARWRELQPLLPLVLYAHAAAFDPVRRRVVVFGGILGGIPTARTFEYSIDTATWFDVSPVISPSPRTTVAMAYDAQRGVVVMFGGYSGGTTFNDTWLWNGRTWTEVETPVAPSRRYGSSMAYDSRRKKIVLFGGQPATSSTTWEWDGTWTPTDVTGAPPPRFVAPMAYDPIRGETVMYGGLNVSTGVIDDGTWIWNGSTWRNVASSEPGIRSQVPMVFDPVRGGLLLTASQGGDTYLWNGVAWSRLGQYSQVIDTLRYFIMFYDPLRETVMTYGGSGPGGVTGAMYQWIPASGTWASFNPTRVPDPVVDVGITYDRRHNVPVRFGGFDLNANVRSPVTYDLVDDAWVVRSASNPPLARREPQLVYDSVQDRLVMFGGDAADPSMYALVDNAWTTIAGGAPVQQFGAATFDPDEDAIMYFGGTSSPSLTANDNTYVFDGTWHQVAGSSAPRVHHVLEYDESAKHAVMVTGDDTTGQPQPQDTWSWTYAGGWTQLLPTTTPTNRTSATATYDPVRKEVVLFGGVNGTAALSDAWRWNGTKWARIDVEIPPRSNGWEEMTYDRVHERFVVYGTGTWILQWTSRLRDEVCQVGRDHDGDGLRGCDDPDCAAVCERCGDATCDPSESCRNCPGDCGVCTPLCGDTYCDGNEAQTCLGDCP